MSLSVLLGRIVGDCEEHLQYLPVRDFLGIEGDLDGFGMTRPARADGIVVSGSRVAAGITGDDLLHSFDLLKNSLDAPETAAREHGSLVAFKILVVDGRVTG